jgi:hypothetical protein
MRVVIKCGLNTYGPKLNLKDSFAVQIESYPDQEKEKNKYVDRRAATAIPTRVHLSTEDA